MRPLLANILRREFSRTSCRLDAKPQFCVVGAGPAGFYAAQHIVKQIPDAQVDIYERLPVPYGLVRFGVAPDHPEVKNVIHTFAKTAEHPHVRFLGNINLGKDVTVKDLQQAYHSVLLTYGADENRYLNIPGEQLVNVLSARNIVGWYNGTPWDRELKVDLSAETAVIVGQGNVAVDVARILLTPVDELRTTDITAYALDALSRSRIKRVVLVGRRGPLQAAFTIKELREMLKLSSVRTIFTLDDFHGIDAILPSLPRPKKRITELMLTALKTPPKSDCAREFVVKFCRSPVEFVPGDDGRVAGMRMTINTLRGVDYTKEVAVPTSQIEEMSCDLAITSIGYKSIQADPDIPFDAKKGVVANSNFKICEHFYASGWLATGPTGVILTTMSNAFATADVIVKETIAGRCDMQRRAGFEAIAPLLREKNVQVVEWSNWLKIDRHEQAAGANIGKPREKVVDIAEMLKIAS